MQRLLAPNVRSAVNVRRTSSIRPVRRTLKTAVSASLDPNYGYVLGSVGVTAGVLQFLAIKVALARRTCGIKYPKMYADGDDDNANIFNCTQRAHQNTLEYAPATLAMVLGLGLQYPIMAASLNMVWNVGRIVYANGYSTGDPSKRAPGAAVSSIAYLVLIFANLYAGLKLANVLPF